MNLTLQTDIISITDQGQKVGRKGIEFHAASATTAMLLEAQVLL